MSDIYVTKIYMPYSVEVKHKIRFQDDSSVADIIEVIEELCTIYNNGEIILESNLATDTYDLLTIPTLDLVYDNSPIWVNVEFDCALYRMLKIDEASWSRIAYTNKGKK